ncbi:hypothetical protein SEUCBS139899_002938 [Sporothrix eucalyptigena]|uniref:Uncharacterized protein n=1 Tax=Sporothrix eucalyptigena TaxID=1812306 RepID=A0ABP0CUH5_9PEZI
MGLVLYSSADGDPSPSCRDRYPDLTTNDRHQDAYLVDLVAHNRYIPASRGKTHDWRVGPSKSRLSARRQAAFAYRYNFDFMGHRLEESEVHLLRHGPVHWPHRLRPHQIRLLHRSSHLYFDRWHHIGEVVGANYPYERLLRRQARGPPHIRGQRRSVRDEWVNETAVDLPGTRRPPSLERQGAFRAASTTKKRTSPPISSFDDPDVAELYQLGILYDNEHERGAGFGLNAIVHDAPLYTISTAPSSRRGRERGKQPELPPSEMFEDIDLDSISDDVQPLDLALSFANLADDAALARFLQDEEMAAYLDSLPEGIEHDPLPFEVTSPAPSSSPSSSSSQQPVTVIYELVPEVEPSPNPDSVSDAGDWVLDMDTAEDQSSIDGDSILFRADGDTDGDTDADEAWFFLRP